MCISYSRYIHCYLNYITNAFTSSLHNIPLPAEYTKNVLELVNIFNNLSKSSVQTWTLSRKLVIHFWGPYQVEISLDFQLNRRV